MILNINFYLRFPFPSFFFLIVIVLSWSRACFLSFLLDPYCFVLFFFLVETVFSFFSTFLFFFKFPILIRPHWPNGPTISLGSCLRWPCRRRLRPRHRCPRSSTCWSQPGTRYHTLKSNKVQKRFSFISPIKIAH